MHNASAENDDPQPSNDAAADDDESKLPEEPEPFGILPKVHIAAPPANINELENEDAAMSTTEPLVLAAVAAAKEHAQPNIAFGHDRQAELFAESAADLESGYPACSSQAVVNQDSMESMIVAVGTFDKEGEDETAFEVRQITGFEGTSWCKALPLYTRKVVKHPCKILCFYIVVMLVVIVVGLLSRPLELDTDFSAFVRADGPAMRQREAYLMAYDAKKKMNGDERRLKQVPNEVAQDLANLEIEHDVEEEGELLIDADAKVESSVDRGAGRRLKTPIPAYFMQKSLTIIYVGVHGNALDDYVLADLRQFEQRLRSLPGWQALCTGGGKAPLVAMCSPGASLAAYAWPTQVPSKSTYHRFGVIFDGLGSMMLSKAAFFSYLQQSSEKIHELRQFLPRTFSLPPSFTGDEQIPPAQALRSTFTFRLAVGLLGDSGAQVSRRKKKLGEEYKKFAEGELYDFLTSDAVKFEKTKVYFYGDHITAYEITSTLQKDSFWAIGSFLFVTMYLWFHTRSMLLSLSCLAIIFSSVPIAYVMTPSSKTTIASFLSIFLITGVGSDVVFVFKDFWEQSARVTSKPDIRLAWMLIHAGKSCLATSLTTSVSFFANLASILQPLREFGLFMGLCVMTAFVLVCLLLPPLIMLNEARMARKRVSNEGMLVEFTGDVAALSIVPTNTQATCPQKAKEDRASLVRWVMLRIVGFVAIRPGKILAFTGALIIVFVIGIASNAAMAKGIPKVFPEEHNQVQAEKWQGKFATVKPAQPPTRINNIPFQGPFGACKPDTPSDKQGECALNWCEANSSLPKGNATSGFCYQSQTNVSVILNPYTGAAIQNPNTSDLVLKSTFDIEGCFEIRMTSRVASPSPPSNEDWKSSFVDPWALRATGVAPSYHHYLKAKPLKTLGLESWETGNVQMTNLMDMGYVWLRPAKFNITGQTILRRCEIMTLCFIGVEQCSLEGDWKPLGKQSIKTTSTTTMSPGSGRRLALAEEVPEPARERMLRTVVIHDQKGRYKGETIPLNKVIDVTIVWGILPAVSTPLVGAPDQHWSYDKSFDPGNPWAQRAIYRACMDVPAELQVITTNCWIYEFRSWLLKPQQDGFYTKRFPTRDFDEEVKLWKKSPVGAIQGPENLWIIGGKVKAMKVGFDCNFRSDASAEAGIAYRDMWDTYIAHLNLVSSVTANRAFHSAELFKRAEAEIALVGSTVETIIIAASLAWLCMLIFTGDAWIAVLVTGLVLGIISGLAFFMVVPMDWDIGAIEVISLVVFMGYSVTYALHIAHNFTEVGEENEELIRLEQTWAEKQRKREERKTPGPSVLPASRCWSRFSMVSFCGRCYRERSATKEDRQRDGELDLASLRRAKTRMAILHVGGATLSSAVSTIGSSFFLLFCTMNIFKQLGAVVITVTLLSIVFALVPLQALLMLAGSTKTCLQRLRDGDFRSGQGCLSRRHSEFREPLVAREVDTEPSLHTID
jgi:hypothetical protein